MHSPIISICIPIYKSDSNLFELIEDFSNRLENNFELVILETIENKGDQGIEERLRLNFPYTKISYQNILKSDFSHGKARNQLVLMSSTKYVLLTTQDIRIERWENFQEIICALEKNSIDAICAIHVPNKTAYSKLFHKMFKELLKINLDEVLPSKFPWWSHNLALYSKESLTFLPFTDIAYAEDLLWAKQARALNFRLLITDAISIKHFNTEGLLQSYKRGLIEGRAHFQRNAILGIPNDKERGSRILFQRFLVLMRHDFLDARFFLKIPETLLYIRDLVQCKGRIDGYREAPRFRSKN
jgi:glycosyltransferase involved in cell wall biosynthesis